MARPPRVSPSCACVGHCSFHTPIQPLVRVTSQHILGSQAQSGRSTPAETPIALPRSLVYLSQRNVIAVADAPALRQEEL